MEYRYQNLSFDQIHKTFTMKLSSWLIGPIVMADGALFHTDRSVGMRGYETNKKIFGFIFFQKRGKFYQ